ncbi:putative phage protein (predicted DNA packaging) [Cytobacillus purgationiresistens]|uniref:Phage protein (Predicted DNA packaging) n=1 Tax=Cytobacillus purgationiresistens TaxID=863449 RepID=A0ABU0AEL7_9BACI|nr:putative phage protein (predicted DNA packaging) [Cytobacillus purgationiresistens]
MTETVKEYLRIDGTEDDKLLGFLIDSAKEYLTGAGVKGTDSKRYELAVIMLVTHWYENREAVGKVLGKVQLGLQSIILQLKAEGLKSE